MNVLALVTHLVSFMGQSVALSKIQRKRVLQKLTVGKERKSCLDTLVLFGNTSRLSLNTVQENKLLGNSTGDYSNRSWYGANYFRQSELTFANIYSYLEKGCRKKCTGQSRKVLWVILSSLFFKEI